MSAYLFFRAPHGIELRAYKAENNLFYQVCILTTVGLDNVPNAPEFVTPPCRFSVRNLVGKADSPTGFAEHIELSYIKKAHVTLSIKISCC